MAAWVNDVAHFGSITTSMAEGTHSAMKTRVSTSRGDVYILLRRIVAMQRHQVRILAGHLEEERIRALHITRERPLMQEVWRLAIR